MQIFLRRRVGLFLVWLLILLAGCGTGETAPTAVTVQLGWFHTAEYAGFYVADQEGYYRDENLAVTFVPGGTDIDPIKEVVENRAHFGVTTNDGVILARSQGHDVVAIAAIYRQSPLNVMVLAESGIERLQDLEGKRIGVVSTDMNSLWDLQLLQMLDQAQVDRETISFVPIQEYHGANDLLSGRMDAMSSSFATNEPVVARAEGHEVVTLFYSDYGAVNYVNPILTRGELIRSQPDVVQRFMRATLKGYRYALEHPDEAVAHTLKYDESLDQAVQRATMQEQIPLIDTGNAPVGWMDQNVWESTQAIMLQSGVITSPVPLDALFTNTFVEQVEQ